MAGGVDPYASRGTPPGRGGAAEGEEAPRDVRAHLSVDGASVRSRDRPEDDPRAQDHAEDRAADRRTEGGSPRWPKGRPDGPHVVAALVDGVGRDREVVVARPRAQHTAPAEQELHVV